MAMVGGRGVETGVRQGRMEAKDREPTVAGEQKRVRVHQNSSLWCICLFPCWKDGPTTNNSNFIDGGNYPFGGHGGIVVHRGGSKNGASGDGSASLAETYLRN